MTTNTIIADRMDQTRDEEYDLLWDCDVCEGVDVPHEFLSETVTDGGNQYYIDTMIKCLECGTEHEVTESSHTDPR